MAYALVGTIGAASQGASGASVTPAWGTSENRTVGNLLICFISVQGAANVPSGLTGWTQAILVNPSTCSASIYYKIAAGSDAAPTINAITGGVIAAQLAEFSGGATSSPSDRVGQGSSTASPLVVGPGVTDTSAGELLLMCGTDFRSTARASNDTWTSNSGTVTQAGNNNGVSTVNHYSMGYILSTTQNASAHTVTMTCSITTSITNLGAVSASFLLPPAVPLPDLAQQPLTPARSHK